MRIKNSKLVRRFAFVTNEAYESIGFIKSRWPITASVGSNYKVVNYLLGEESDLKALSESLGYQVKELSFNDTVKAMNESESGPFICSHKQAKEIINNYSGEMG